MKYEVKIPKIYNIDKAHMMEYLNDYVRDIAYNYVTGKVCDLGIIKLCRDFFCGKMGVKGETVYVKKEEYDREMLGGKKQFKNSCYSKVDSVVIFDKIYWLCEKTIPFFGEPDMIDPEINKEDKVAKIYSRIMEALTWEEC